jgi:diguanylate cyclase (GGDEF)-like protein/PAS domain S-box-containing protein
MNRRRTQREKAISTQCPFDENSGTLDGCHRASLDRAHSTLQLLKQKSEQLDIIQDLAILLLQRTSLEDVLWLVARSTIARLGFEDCVIYLLDDSGKNLVQKAAFGPKNPYGKVILDPIVIPVGQGIVGSVALTGKHERILDTRKDDRYIVDDQMRLSELAVPIIHEEQVIGVIDSEHTEAHFYTAEQVDLLTTIASIAANKIANALNIERLNSTVLALQAAHKDLKLEQERYRTLYDHHPSMFFVLDSEGVIQSVNDYARNELGFDSDKMVGRPLSDFGPDVEQVQNAVRGAVSGPPTAKRWETRRWKADGSVIWVRDTARILTAGVDSKDSLLVVSEDVTDAFQMAKKLRYQASHDELTGLHNRREFEQQVTAAILECQGVHCNHAVLYLDLDQFKLINDSCGHAAGDELLRQLANVLQEHVRRADVVARLGGDEFGVLMKQCSVPDAMRIASTLRRAVENYRFYWGGKVLSVGASIGVVPLDASSGTLAQVLAAADNACFGAKDAGRNRIHLYSEADAETTRRNQEMRMAVRLGEAVERNRFRLYCQPIVPLGSDGSFATCWEFLLRMRDSNDELILPGAFLPAAERYGMIPRIDRWVVCEALKWLSSHHPNPEPGWMFFINLSGLSVSEPGFMQFLSETLAEATFPPSMVCFEITETAAISNLIRTREFVTKLKESGCSFALDDFGSGLSSFAYLKSLPVDFIKIDGQFIQDIVKDPVSAVMVRSINEVAKMMDKKTVAEFVEDEATLTVLREIGVDFVQGHFLGHPRSVKDFGLELASARPAP